MSRLRMRTYWAACAALVAMGQVSCTGCTAGTESVERKVLATGEEPVQAVLVWSNPAEPNEPRTLIVEYLTNKLTAEAREREADSVWRLVRRDAEQRSFRRVAIRPTLSDRGFAWPEQRSSTWTFWHRRAKDGPWVAADLEITLPAGLKR